MDDMDDHDRIDGFIEKQRLKNKEACLEIGGFRPEVNNQVVPKLIGDKMEALNRIAKKRARSQASHAWMQTRDVKRE